MALIGTVLHDKWRIDAKIARGGVATVFRATHRQGQRAAIKILHPEFARNDEVRRRFLREGYAANKVGHRGVVRVLDDDVTSDGSAYIVMELLEHGECVEDRRERLGGRLPVAESVDICHQVLDVLAVAHEKGIVHRDIKPDNIFLLADGTVKVLDFGIAHIREAAKQHETTATGLVLGTPGYMSPEQVLGKRGQIDAQTDIYAVGATLFTLLSGEPVHPSDDPTSLLLAAAIRPARSLGSAVKDLPRALVVAVDKALAMDKPMRWRSARAMQEALRKAAPAPAVVGVPIATPSSAPAVAPPATPSSAPVVPAAAASSSPARSAPPRPKVPIPRPPRPTLEPAPKRSTPADDDRPNPPSAPPSSLPPSSAATTVIPLRSPPGGSSRRAPSAQDPWTAEFSADDLDAPTVATTGGATGVPAPAVPSSIVERPPLPSMSSEESTLPIALDELEAMQSKKTLKIPRAASQAPPATPAAASLRASAAPQPKPPVHTPPEPLPPPGRALPEPLPPSFLGTPPEPRPPPGATAPYDRPPATWEITRSARVLVAAPDLRAPLPYGQHAPLQREPTRPQPSTIAIAVIAFGALLLIGIALGSCLLFGGR